MKRLLFTSLALASLSLAACLWWFAYRLDSHVAVARQDLADSADMLDARMEAESARYAALLASESAKWRTATEARLAAIQRDTDKRLAAIQADTREQLQNMQQLAVPVRDSLVSAINGHAKLADELRPAVADGRKLLTSTDALVTKATPQVIGLAAGWKQAGGFSAATIRMVQPDLKVITTEGAKAAPTARKTIENVEKMTRPPNIFMRILGPIIKLLF